MDQITKDMGGFTLIYHKSSETQSAMTTVGPQEIRLPPPAPETKIYPAGYRAIPTTWPLPCAMKHMHDVAIPMRDGVKLYCDVYLPDKGGRYPAIIGWTPFNKGPNPQGTQDGFKEVGMPDKGYVSGFETFEGVDPAWWVNHDYAVVFVDVRGAYNSEGNGEYFGNGQDAEDGYDAIEWLAAQEWCNGKCTMAGNSWLAIAQWYIAAKNPPSLACIAPWEGHGNMYRDEYMRGGIPKFEGSRDYFCPGRGYQEDLKEMMRRNPCMNDYWESHCAPFEDIRVPVYAAASYTNWCHPNGTFDAFMRCGSEKKWLRVHNYVEWPDLYNYANSEDLCKFFDKYCKNIDNNWEATPKVRLSVLDPGGTDIVGRPEENWPLRRQQFKKLYLDASDRSLKQSNPAAEAEVAYESQGDVVHCRTHKEEFDRDTGNCRVKFTCTIPEETEVTGYITLHTWVECRGHDDMDLFVRILNLDKDGNYLYHDCVWNTYSGPDNRLRVSLREVDTANSTEHTVEHTFRNPRPLHPGEIVPIDIQFWPTSQIFHAGEQLQLVIASYDYLGFPPMGGDLRNIIKNYNQGTHVIHTGGQYKSWLELPVIPRA